MSSNIPLWCMLAWLKHTLSYTYTHTSRTTFQNDTLLNTQNCNVCLHILYAVVAAAAPPREVVGFKHTHHRPPVAPHFNRKYNVLLKPHTHTRIHRSCVHTYAYVLLKIHIGMYVCMYTYYWHIHIWTAKTFHRLPPHNSCQHINKSLIRHCLIAILINHSYSFTCITCLWHVAIRVTQYTILGMDAYNIRNMYI